MPGYRVVQKAVDTWRWGALALMLTLVVAPAVAAVPESKTLKFQVQRDGNNIGTHTLRFEEKGDALHVHVNIELEVRIAFVPVYSYSHRNHEVWRDGRLVSLSSETNDDGTRYRVEAEATDDGLRVESSEEGSFTAPADILTTSYWNPKVMERDQLLDTQYGRLVDLQIEERGRESLDTLDGSVQATRYSVSGDLEMDIWYDAQGHWSGLEFQARGEPVRYLRAPVDPASASNS